MRQFVRVDEVAALLGVTPQTIRNWIREDKIKAQRFGRPHLIPVSEVARILNKSQVEVEMLLEDSDRGDSVPALFGGFAVNKAGAML